MVLSGDKHTRRDWLHSRAAEIVGLVFAEDIRIATEITHELKERNLVVNETVESSSDTFKEHYVFNYHNAKLGMSLLLTNIQDATKEVDNHDVPYINWYGKAVREEETKLWTAELSVSNSADTVYEKYRSSLSAQMYQPIQKSTFLTMWRESTFNNLHCTIKSIVYRRERQVYLGKARASFDDPTAVLSIIIDGMDRNKTPIPHFAQKPRKMTNTCLRTSVHLENNAESPETGQAAAKHGLGPFIARYSMTMAYLRTSVHLEDNAENPGRSNSIPYVSDRMQPVLKYDTASRLQTPKSCRSVSADSSDVLATMIDFCTINFHDGSRRGGCCMPLITSAEGAEAFDDLCHIVDVLVQNGAPAGWAKTVKTDCKTHVDLVDRCGDHCRGFALSDKDNAVLAVNCNHNDCDRRDHLLAVTSGNEDDH
ncbi:hypothetical protein Bbelb_050240 [Branchiostoma belcheri]|nr:hypothetical protein Bbelb_050240 [Branchiostoma belcheri]